VTPQAPAQDLKAPDGTEQRKGRIERIGQEAEAIDILNLRYRGSVEDEVHRPSRTGSRTSATSWAPCRTPLEDVGALAAEGEMEEAKRRIDALPRRHPFAQRYTDSVPPTDWNRCEQV
jgi:hypothetical protein